MIYLEQYKILEELPKLIEYYEKNLPMIQGEDLKTRFVHYKIEKKYPQKYGRLENFCKDTNLSDKTYYKMIRGEMIDVISLIKFVIGLKLEYEEAIVCLTLYGISLFSDNPNIQDCFVVLELLKYSDFRALESAERIIEASEICEKIKYHF